MAYEFNDLKGLLLLVLISIPAIDTTNINCHGKPFHCVNSTHFMICVDVGNGISSTIDDFVIECPATTVCHPKNQFECDFPVTEEPPPPLHVIGVSEATKIPFSDPVTIQVPVRETAVLPLVEENLPKLEEAISPNLTEQLESLKDEFTGGKETFIEPHNISPSTESQSHTVNDNTTGKNNVIVTDMYKKINDVASTELPSDKVTEVFVTRDTEATSTSPPIAGSFVTPQVPVTKTVVLPLVEENLVKLEEAISPNLTEPLESLKDEFTGANETFIDLHNISASTESHTVNDKTTGKNNVKVTDIDKKKNDVTSTELPSHKVTEVFVTRDTEATSTSPPNAGSFVTTQVPVTKTAVLPLVEENFVKLEEAISPNLTEPLESLKDEFTGGNETFIDLHNISPSTESHPVNDKTTGKNNVIVTDIEKKKNDVTSTELPSNKFTEMFNSRDTEATSTRPLIAGSFVTTQVPVKETAVLPLVEENFPKLEGAKSPNLTEQLESFKDEFTGGNETYIELHISPSTESQSRTVNDNTTAKNNVIVNDIDKKINDAPSTELPSHKVTEVIVTRDTEATSTSSPILGSFVTTQVPVRESAVLPLVEENFPKLEGAKSPNLTEQLENFKDEFTGGNETYIELHISPSTESQSRTVNDNTTAKNNVIVNDIDKKINDAPSTELPSHKVTEVIVTRDTEATSTRPLIAGSFDDAMLKDSKDVSKSTHQLETPLILQGENNDYGSVTTFSPIINIDQSVDFVISDSILSDNNYNGSLKNNKAPDITTSLNNSVAIDDKPKSIIIDANNNSDLEYQTVVNIETPEESNYNVEVFGNQPFRAGNSFSNGLETNNGQFITYLHDLPLIATTETTKVESNYNVRKEIPKEDQKEAVYTFAHDGVLNDQATKSFTHKNTGITDTIPSEQTKEAMDFTTESTTKASIITTFHTITTNNVKVSAANITSDNIKQNVKNSTNVLKETRNEMPNTPHANDPTAGVILDQPLEMYDILEDGEISTGNDSANFTSDTTKETIISSLSGLNGTVNNRPYISNYLSEIDIDIKQEQPWEAYNILNNIETLKFNVSANITSNSGNEKYINSTAGLNETVNEIPHTTTYVNDTSSSVMNKPPQESFSHFKHSEKSTSISENLIIHKAEEKIINSSAGLNRLLDSTYDKNSGTTMVIQKQQSEIFNISTSVDISTSNILSNMTSDSPQESIIINVVTGPIETVNDVSYTTTNTNDPAVNTIYAQPEKALNIENGVATSASNVSANSTSNKENEQKITDTIDLNRTVNKEKYASIHRNDPSIGVIQTQTNEIVNISVWQGNTTGTEFVANTPISDSIKEVFETATNSPDINVRTTLTTTYDSTKVNTIISTVANSKNYEANSTSEVIDVHVLKDVEIANSSKLDTTVTGNNKKYFDEPTTETESLLATSATDSGVPNVGTPESDLTYQSNANEYDLISGQIVESNGMIYDSYTTEQSQLNKNNTESQSVLTTTDQTTRGPIVVNPSLITVQPSTAEVINLENTKVNNSFTLNVASSSTQHDSVVSPSIQIKSTSLTNQSDELKSFNSTIEIKNTTTDNIAVQNEADNFGTTDSEKTSKREDNLITTVNSVTTSTPTKPLEVENVLEVKEFISLEPTTQISFVSVTTEKPVTNISNMKQVEMANAFKAQKVTTITPVMTISYAKRLKEKNTEEAISVELTTNNPSIWMTTMKPVTIISSMRYNVQNIIKEKEDLLLGPTAEGLFVPTTIREDEINISPMKPLKVINMSKQVEETISFEPTTENHFDLTTTMKPKISISPLRPLNVQNIVKVEEDISLILTNENPSISMTTMKNENNISTMKPVKVNNISNKSEEVISLEAMNENHYMPMTNMQTKSNVSPMKPIKVENISKLGEEAKSLEPNMNNLSASITTMKPAIPISPLKQLGLEKISKLKEDIVLESTTETTVSISTSKPVTNRSSLKSHKMENILNQSQEVISLEPTNEKPYISMTTIKPAMSITPTKPLDVQNIIKVKEDQSLELTTKSPFVSTSTREDGKNISPLKPHNVEKILNESEDSINRSFNKQLQLMNKEHSIPVTTMKPETTISSMKPLNEENIFKKTEAAISLEPTTNNAFVSMTTMNPEIPFISPMNSLDMHSMVTFKQDTPLEPNTETTILLSNIKPLTVNSPLTPHTVTKILNKSLDPTNANPSVPMTTMTPEIPISTLTPLNLQNIIKVKEDPSLDPTTENPFVLMTVAKPETTITSMKPLNVKNTFEIAEEAISLEPTADNLSVSMTTMKPEKPISPMRPLNVQDIIKVKEDLSLEPTTTNQFVSTSTREYGILISPMKPLKVENSVERAEEIISFKPIFQNPSVQMTSVKPEILISPVKPFKVKNKIKVKEGLSLQLTTDNPFVPISAREDGTILSPMKTRKVENIFKVAKEAILLTPTTDNLRTALKPKTHILKDDNIEPTTQKTVSISTSIPVTIQSPLQPHKVEQILNNSEEVTSPKQTDKTSSIPMTNTKHVTPVSHMKPFNEKIKVKEVLSLEPTSENPRFVSISNREPVILSPMKLLKVENSVKTKEGLSLEPTTMNPFEKLTKTHKVDDFMAIKQNQVVKQSTESPSSSRTESMFNPKVLTDKVLTTELLNNFHSESEAPKYYKMHEEENTVTSKCNENLVALTKVGKDADVTPDSVTTSEVKIDKNEINPMAGHETPTSPTILPNTGAIQRQIVDNIVTTPIVNVTRIGQPPNVVSFDVPTNKPYKNNSSYLIKSQISSVRTSNAAYNIEKINNTKNITYSRNQPGSPVKNSTFDDINLSEIILNNGTLNNQLRYSSSPTNTTALKEALQTDVHDMALKLEIPTNNRHKEEMNSENGNTLITHQMNIKIGLDKKPNAISIKDKFESSTANAEVTSQVQITTSKSLADNKLKTSTHTIPAVSPNGTKDNRIQKENQQISSSSVTESRTKTKTSNVSSGKNRTEIFILDKVQSNGNNRSNIEESNTLDNLTKQRHIVNDKSSKEQRHKVKNQKHERKLINATTYLNEKSSINNTTSPFVCQINTRGKYADSKDCRKFYICLRHLKPIVGTCPKNTVFSEINKHCTRNLSHCVRNNQFHCLYEGRFSDVLKDNVYYICVKHNLHFLRYKLQCQIGYQLNKDTIKCEKNLETSQSSSSTSEKSTTDDDTTTTQEEKSAKSKDKEHFECMKEGKFPYSRDCRKYYVCSVNKKHEFRRKLKKCSQGEIYDKQKEKCISAESTEC